MTISASFIRPAMAGLVRNLWRKSTPITLSTVLLGASPVLASLKDISVINSTPTEFHFVISFENYQSLNNSVETDSLLQIAHTVQVCVPKGATARLVSANGSGSMEFMKSKRSQRMTAKPLVELSEKWTMRGREFVTAIISPVNGDGLYSQVEVRIAFDGANATSGYTNFDPKFDRILSSSVANWDECKSWPVSSGSVSKASAQPGPFAVSADWFKVAVNQSGVHSVSFNDLSSAGFIQSSVPSSEIFIYNSGGEQLNPLLTDPRPVFSQMAIAVEDGGDGVFQPGDRILFYGESLNRWEYDSAGASYIQNHYATQNIYWIAISSSITDTPLRMSSVNAAPTGTAIDTLNSYRHFTRTEQENELRRVSGLIESYYSWYWTSQDTISFYIPVSNMLPGAADVSILAKTYDTAGSGNSPGSYVDLTVNGLTASSKNCNSNVCTYQVNNLMNGLNLFSLRQWGFSSNAPYFDNLEISYQRLAVPLNNSLSAAFGPNGGLIQVDIADNFSSQPLVFDINDPAHPVRLNGATRIGGLLSFETNFELNSANQIYAVGSNNLVNPVSITKVTPVDLYTNSSQTDLIVITSTAFEPALSQYVSYRNADGYSIKTVTVSDIMDNFAFGLYDPSAIRDFLKHSYEFYPAPAPSAVLFVGDANYDYLDHQGTGVPNHVPPYLLSFDNTLSDDNYVFFGEYGLLDNDTSYIGGDRGFDMMPCRWPVKSVAEINSVVSKIISYESPSNFDKWRSNITIVADDEFSPNNPPQVEVLHTQQAEALSASHIPTLINKTKLYSWEYPFVSGNKPAMNTAIVKSINEGTLILNYVGHGNPELWADEHIFTRTADLPRLTNTDRLPLVFAASCAISFFDDPKREGMSEELLSMPGGAIATIAATRLVYSQPNSTFNRAVFDILLYNDSLTICEALYAAKIQRQYDHPTPPVPNTNDRNYLFFGDPLLRLGLPRLDVVADSALDSLQALMPVTIAGRITDDFGTTYQSDGVLEISVFDSERNKFHRLANDTVTIRYSVEGPTLYRGSATISNGAFNFTFIPPLDIGYGGNGAKVSMYAILDTIDAVGVIDSVDVASSVASSTDSSGPEIVVSFSGKPMQPGGSVIQPNEQLEVLLMDSSGINSTGALGHGITLEIDNDAAGLISLSELFQYNQDDYTSGTINYSFSGIEPGVHTFKIKAWDNANNSATLSFDVEIVQSSSLAILDLLNYPNPMSAQTSFSFSLTQAVEKFSLEIFTLSGRKINTFDRYALTPSYYDDIVWDGRDAYGDRVATGVYLYKATAIPTSGDEVKEFGKIVLINQ